MAQTHKVLGQSNPAATTLTTLYTVPASTQTIGSTLSICNLGTAGATYRVAVRPAGAAIANQHYITYDAVVSAYDTVFLTLGISLATTDVVSVYASSATVAFSLFGVEIT
jgi:hypothetical protein